MKKTVWLLLLVAFLMGCGTAAQRSEFYQHDTHYKNWDHMKFSWFTYQQPTKDDAKMSGQQGWWGEPVNYEGD